MSSIRSRRPRTAATRPREQGQGLIETALALPVLLLLFMTLMQLIAWGWASLLCTHAVQAAARVYTVRHAEGEDAALKLAQGTAERIMAKALPSILWPQMTLVDAVPGECSLRLKAFVPPLWGWRWALSHFSFMTIERRAFVEDEATEARLQEDAFKQP